MGLFDEDLYSNRAKEYMRKAYIESGRTEFQLEEIVKLANGTFVTQEPAETIFTEQQMTDGIRKENPDYAPNPERMAHDASMIPQVREAISKGVLSTVNTFVIKLSTAEGLYPGRINLPMINYAHKYCADQIGEIEARGIKLVDEYNAAKSDVKILQSLAKAADEKEKYPNNTTIHEYEKAFAAKDTDSEIVRHAKSLSGNELADFVKGHVAQQKDRFREIDSIKGKMAKTACNHLVKHIWDKDPVTGRTLSETMANHMNTPEEIAENYPDAYIRMKAIAECEYFITDGTISESEYGVEEFGRFVKALDETMPLTLAISSRTTVYASPLCGIVDIDEITKGGNINIESLNADITLAHPAVSQLCSIGGTVAAQYAATLRGVTGSGNLTYVSEDGKLLQVNDFTKPENTRDLLKQGKLMYAVSNDKLSLKPTPFMFDKQGKIYVGDEIAKHAAEMKEPKIDPSVKKPGAFARFLGNISNSLKSDAVKKWDKAVADYDAAMKEYRNFKGMAAKTTPEKLDAARNKVDAANAKNAGKSVKEYQKEMAAKEKADRESYNSKLFEEANAEVTAEKEAKAEAKHIMVDQIKLENAKEYNKEKLLDAFAKHCPQGIPDQLRSNIEKISDVALESQNKLTEVVNYNTSIKGADVKNELKGVAAYNEMLMAAGSDKLSPERLEIYSHPDYPAIANNMLDKNVAIEYAAGTTFKPESFKAMVLNGELMKNFGDYFSKQVQESIEASKQMTVDKANGIQEQPQVQEEKPVKAPSAMGMH